jgi:hypothetical protein
MELTTIEIIRGDTKTIVFQVTRSDVPVDLTGSLLYFTVKNAVTDADAALLFQKTVGAGIVISDQVTNTGECQITISPADTATIGLASQFPVACVYDLQLREPSTRVTTVMRGAFVVHPDVTRA